MIVVVVLAVEVIVVIVTKIVLADVEEVENTV